MKTERILFTSKGEAKLCEVVVPDLTETGICTRTLYTAISCGTERACLMDLPNTYRHGQWPKGEGYAAVSIVEEVGPSVKSVRPGDRVLVYHGAHAAKWMVEERRVVRIEDDSISSSEAPFLIIASFTLSGIRKMDVEIGESVLVMGLGVLGIFGVQLLRANGACPIIAADFRKDRRRIALECGADVVLDPASPNFVAQVKAASGEEGVKAAVEVTGSAQAMVTTLDCCAPFGRVALVGCTRVSDAPIDYYRQIHRRGIKLIGAHTDARPQLESWPHMWTDWDDQRALLKLLRGGRIRVPIQEKDIHDPSQASDVYHKLANDPDFPIFSAFRWFTPTKTLHEE